MQEHSGLLTGKNKGGTGEEGGEERKKEGRRKKKKESKRKIKKNEK